MLQIIYYRVVWIQAVTVGTQTNAMIAMRVNRSTRSDSQGVRIDFCDTMLWRLLSKHGARMIYVHVLYCAITRLLFILHDDEKTSHAAVGPQVYSLEMCTRGCYAVVRYLRCIWKRSIESCEALGTTIR